MRRRLATIAPAALLSIALLLPLTAVPAVAAVDDAAIVLATEGAGSDAGLEPRDADNTENEFAPEQYEKNWTANAGVALFALILLISVLIGVGYYVRVARFARETRQS